MRTQAYIKMYLDRIKDRALLDANDVHHFCMFVTDLLVHHTSARGFELRS